MKLRIYLLMLCLFLLGVGSGVLLTFGLAKQQIREVTSSSTPEITSLVVNFLDRKLKLSAAQESEIRKVLEAGEQKVLPLRREFRKQSLLIIQKYRPMVAEQLDADQKAELNRLVENLFRIWRLTGNPDTVP